MNRVRKNDTVEVICGGQRGERGSVLDILLKKDKVLVKGVAITTRHAKARKQGETSGIKKQERYIPLSNVMPVCTACKKATRVNFVVIEDESKRTCNRCKEIF